MTSFFKLTAPLGLKEIRMQINRRVTHRHSALRHLPHSKERTVERGKCENRIDEVLTIHRECVICIEHNLSRLCTARHIQTEVGTAVEVDNICIS